MSKVFDENFYTEEFDQEILDFIVERGWKLEGPCWGTVSSINDTTLYYGTGIEGFWTDSEEDHFGFVLLTKQAFKEKIGMTTKQFTKSDLLDGMRVVYRDGDERIVFGGNLYSKYVGGLSHAAKLEEFEDDLTGIYHSEMDIIKVTDRDDTVLFIRQEDPTKSPAQIELDKLQEQIAQLQEQANKLQGRL